MYFVVFSTANHKSAISHILMFGSSHDAKPNHFSFFMNFDVTQRKFSERALVWRMWLYARAGRPVKSVGPYISARFSWESHIILEESSPVIKSGPLKLLLHCTAFFLCFLDFRLKVRKFQNVFLTFLNFQKTNEKFDKFLTQNLKVVKS